MILYRNGRRYGAGFQIWRKGSPRFHAFIRGFGAILSATIESNPGRIGYYRRVFELRLSVGEKSFHEERI